MGCKLGLQGTGHGMIAHGTSFGYYRTLRADDFWCAVCVAHPMVNDLVFRDRPVILISSDEGAHCSFLRR